MESNDSSELVREQVQIVDRYHQSTKLGLDANAFGD